MQLIITSEKVVDAAKTCPDAERVLKILFPSAFLSPSDGRLSPGMCGLSRAAVADCFLLERRTGGSLKDRGFCLPGYGWQVERDDTQNCVLTKRP